MLPLLRTLLVLLFICHWAPRALATFSDYDEHFNDVDKSVSSKSHGDGAKKITHQDSMKEFCGSSGEDLCQETIAHQYCSILVHHNDGCDAKFDPGKAWNDSCYCGEAEGPNKQINLCCVFRYQGADLSSRTLTQPIVKLVNGTNFRVHVDQQKVHELRVFNSTNSAFTQNRTKRTELGSTFSAVNSTGRHVPRFGTVRLYKSNFYAISDNLAIEAISLVDSSVDNVLNMSTRIVKNDGQLPQEDLASKFCFKTEKVTVNRLEHVNLECFAFFNQSKFSRVQSVSFEFLKFLDGFIGTIFSGGLTVTQNGLKMTNVRIRYLHGEAIVARPPAIISLTNVSVDHCDEPCFVVSKAILLKNVTVNGRKFSDNIKDGAILNATSRIYVAPALYEITPWICSEKGDYMVCNNIPTSQPLVVFVVVNDELKRYNVKVADHTHLKILEGCQHSVEITNIAGSYYPFRNFSCDPRFPIRLSNSNLTAFVSTQVKDLIISGSTKIDFLNVPWPLEHFTALNLKIGTIENLKFQRKEKTDFRYFGGTIKAIKNLILYSPSAKFFNVSIAKIEFEVEILAGAP